MTSKWQRSLTPRWPLILSLLRSHVWLYRRIIVFKSHEIHQSTWIQWPFKKMNQWSLTPRWPLTPKSIEVTPVILPKDHCVQVPWKYIKVCGYSYPFFKNLNQRSLTPRWPLTPSVEVTCVTLPKDHCVPSPMGIHQCMWIHWSILGDHSLFLNIVQDKKGLP